MPLGRFHTHLALNHTYRTDARDKIFFVLFQNGPIPRSDLVSMLADERATVYRTLKLFREIGVTQEAGDGQVELTDRFRQHRHYIWCRHCGRRTDFYNEQLEKAIARIAIKRRCALEDHRIELVGLCEQCNSDGSVPGPRANIGTRTRRAPGFEDLTK